MDVKRITKDAILLAVFTVTGMFSIPFGDNIKVSLQFMMLIITLSLVDGVFDAILIPALYLLLGLVAPIYAGFMSGITPTFGFVISFVVIAPIFYLLMRYLKMHFCIKFLITCSICLFVVYIIGTIFMMLYLNFDLGKTLLIAVVPYIGFDIAKIVLALLIVKMMPNYIKPAYIVNEK